ncbi:membrane protein containing Patatin domain protein [Rhodopirellula maiorica SM1]|uniref:Membrane protein containing Patatin domain protein n=1 Tax=Rhodopirellula maiorica SM1 TaxID=1265738 RepID=M5RCJ5_9BACT|nr:patatin-like phospholipase family protein [Rhodopirellula maiorica]EMI17105.1 membrane protein containing Patatin domain protein [Rhodopirellula maiorica SM1]
MITWKQWLLGESPEQDSDAVVAKTDNAAAQELAVRLGDDWGAAEFQPNDADKRAAWEFYSQLRSRIVTRPLPYLRGDEKTALDSVYRLFACAREICKEAGPEAHRFADLVWTFLNTDVRPFTAKWHKPFSKGKLSEDDNHDFRLELERLQRKVRYYEQLFLALALGKQIQLPATNDASPDHEDDKQDSAWEFSEILFSPSVDSATAAAVHQKELSAIRERRGLDKHAEVTNLTGLALSGGGLRSATFALGALQGLANNAMLANFDYMSTVSGGGYAGSFLSCFLNSTAPSVSSVSDPTSSIGLEKNNLPFARSATQESAPMRHLRSSSKALLTGGFWKRLEIPVLAFAGWLASFFVVLPPLLLFTLLICLLNQEAISNAFEGDHPYMGWWWEQSLVASILTLFALCLVLITVLQHYRRKRGETDLPETALRWVGFLFLFLMAMFAWWAFPLGARLSHVLKETSQTGFMLPGESVIAVLSAIAIPIVSRLSTMTSKTSRWKPVLATIAVGILPLIFVWMVATLIASHFLFIGVDRELVMNRWWWLLGLAVVVFAVTHWLLNINACSLHPFYRDRLARAYHLKLDSHGNVIASSPQKLSQLTEKAPYHLINASLNAPAGHREALRGRTADFFMFSKHFCGSESTGYFATENIEETDPSVDLATAVAISGAAASPFMGVNNSRFNFWAALFNVRLDYWLRVPNREKGMWDGNPGPLYWLRQFIGDVRDTYPYVNLSDGGHIENMGIYELLRRRCRYIVLVDGECDPGITCGSFLQVIRYAKIDFGIDIKIDLSRLKFADARAETDAGIPTETPPTGKAASPTVDYHFALGEIDYGDGKTGWLLYLKSSISGNEGKAIESYREREPEFPHQSTADLAYDEEQFESYRALGEHIASDTCSEELVGATSPTDIPNWFKEMRKRLHGK